MKTNIAVTRASGLLYTALLAGFLALGSGAVSAQGTGGGGGQGGGGQGGGGQGGAGETPDLGDMIVLLRDANGVPVPSPEVVVTDPETGQPATGGLCLQPLAAPGVAVVNTVDGTLACTPAPTESCLIPLDALTCSIVVGYESYAQAVDFARMNVARAPASVVDQQLTDLAVNLSTAQCLSLDPAGRIVFNVPDTLDSDGDGDTTELISSAVDSPLQNLAIYREMMTKGYLGAAASPITLPTPAIPNYGPIDTAAKGLGAAADKGGKIDVDVVVYLNQILGLSKIETPTVLPKICKYYRQEVQGVMQLVEKCFLDYSAHKYARTETYGNLPFPAYIPAAQPQPGWFEYLTLYSVATPTTPNLFWITTGPIVTGVFAGAPGNIDGNVGGFAQAADDARAVIDFMHSHPVLIGYESPVICSAVPPQPAAKYDVALSTLQMPIRMVGATVREGTVSVTNNGPDPASGSVTVTGTPDAGTWTYSDTQPFENLAAASPRSWTIVFTGPSYATTITWTATVNAPSDVLSSNNSLTATTKVQKPRGGRGSGEGE